MDQKSKTVVKIVSKLYPIPYKNGRGYYIGDYTVQMDAKQLPMSSIDQVDFMLNKLFHTMKNENLAEDDPKRVPNNDIIPFYKKEIVFEPIRAVAKKGGSKNKSSRKKRGGSLRNKSSKNKSWKKKE